MTTAGIRILALFPAVGRADRLIEVRSGDAPREFFYGNLHLLASGADVRFGDSRKDPPRIPGRLWLWAERYRNRLTNFGLTKQRIVAIREDVAASDVAISFTDAFSISLGYYRHVLDPETVLIGGFHGLADLVDGVPRLFRSRVRRSIEIGTSGLDHLFFMGEADRQEAVRRYAIPPDKTSLFHFGVDTNFWSPADPDRLEEGVLSVGSDPKRDYETLLAAPISAQTHILTSLAVRVPSNRPNVHLVSGNFYGSPITDSVLRELYRRAAVVVVPIRDVFQPSGQSVTLQAMACGKPVVLSRTKGLWDPETLISGENCVLVAPHDPATLGEAVNRLLKDGPLRQRIGAAARQTVVEKFGLDRMNRCLEHMIQSVVGRCRTISAQNSRAVPPVATRPGSSGEAL